MLFYGKETKPANEKQTGLGFFFTAMNPIADLRKDYTRQSLDESTISTDPLKQFEIWFSEALNSQVPEPNAMTLSTVSDDGQPSSRVVLLKALEGGRFVFFTNYQSTKGKHLAKNPACALNFFWPDLERQVRIEGIAIRLEESDSVAYFQSRPRESQIGAWASPQSALIVNRDVLEARARQLAEKYKDADTLPKPNQWGGFAVDAMRIEFWQGRPSRLHDRLVFTRWDNEWKLHRLAP